MERNVETMKRLRANSEYNRTVQGRALQWAGRLFALYCVFRTLSVLMFLHRKNISLIIPSQSIINVVVPYRSHKPTESGTTSYPDLIAHFLSYAISLLPSVHLSEENVAAISRQIGLALVGAIILSSIRFILKAVSRVSTQIFMLYTKRLNYATLPTVPKVDQPEPWCFVTASNSCPTNGERPLSCAPIKECILTYINRGHTSSQPLYKFALRFRPLSYLQTRSRLLRMFSLRCLLTKFSVQPLTTLTCCLRLQLHFTFGLMRE